MADRIRNTRSRPCPVCGGHDGQPRGEGIRCHGFTSEDARYAHCSREERAGGVEPNGAGLYAHYLAGACKCGAAHGNGSTPPAGTLFISKSRVVQTTRYPCIDAKGCILALHVRRDLDDGSKSFAWELPDGKKGLGGISVASLPLYNLPALFAGPNDAPVIVVEGEKACDALTAKGILGVATVTGANGTPQDDVLQLLVGHAIYLWPDHDDVGRAHMNRIASSLVRLGSRPRVITWPDARREGEDAADFVARGGTHEKLKSIIESAVEISDPKPVESRIVLVRLSEVEPKPVKWLWKGRIPLGKITIVDGDPGLGKSLISLDIAARVTTGKEMPDGSRGDLTESAGVVLLSAEDDAADTIRPRLDLAGADASRVCLLFAVREKGKEKDIERGPTLLDIEALREAITRTDAKLVVIDPFSAFISGTDSYVDAEIRELLAPLAKLAAETGVAIVLVRHLNKSTAGNPIYRGGGSIGIIGAARSGLLVAKDPDDPEDHRCVLAATKSNLAVLPPSLAYHIEAKADVPRVVWEGTSLLTATDLLAGDQDRGALEDAEEFLQDALRYGARPPKEVIREARQAGISDRTLQRAKSELGVRSRKDSFSGGWFWRLPGHGQDDQEGEDAPVPPVGNLRQSGVEKDLKAGNIEDCQPPTLATFVESGPQAELGKREDCQLAGLAAFGETPSKPNLNAELPKMASGGIGGGGSPGPAAPRCNNGHTHFWKSVQGTVVCSTCHSPPFDDLVTEWIDLPGGAA